MPRRPFSDFMEPWERIARPVTRSELALARLFITHGATLRERWPDVYVGRAEDPHATTIRALFDCLDLDRALFEGRCLACGDAIFPIALFSLADAGGVTSACAACGGLQLRMVRGTLGAGLVGIVESQTSMTDGVLKGQPFGTDGRVWLLPAPGQALRAVVGEIDDPARFDLGASAARGARD